MKKIFSLHLKVKANKAKISAQQSEMFTFRKQYAHQNLLYNLKTGILWSTSHVFRYLIQYMAL